jgi:hypothetical protein
MNTCTLSRAGRTPDGAGARWGAANPWRLGASESGARRAKHGARSGSPVKPVARPCANAALGCETTLYGVDYAICGQCRQNERRRRPVGWQASSPKHARRSHDDLPPIPPPPRHSKGRY